jgi:hypothetical protein
MVLLSAGCLTILLSCGEDKTLQPQQNSAFGTAGNVLVADTEGRQLWVGFNSASEWETFLETNSYGAGKLMIGGEVVADSTQTLGFHLDPGTTMVYGTTDAFSSLWIQTTLAEVQADPARFASMYGVLVPVTVQRYVSDRMW